MKILYLTARRALCRKLPWQATNHQRKYVKGLIRNGHDVMDFSYSDALMQFSPFKTVAWALRRARRKVIGALVALAREYEPDMVLMTNLPRLPVEAVSQLKQTVPDAVFVGMYSDQRAECDPDVLAVARLCDWFLATGAGRVLRDYRRRGVPHCAFMPNPADPDVEGPRPVPPRWRSDVLFTGKLIHKLTGQDPQREDLIRMLVARKGMTVWGCLGRPSIAGRDYVNAICGAKIALSINAFNDVPLYHSDRLTHYLGHGAFVLAKYVPGSELLFEDQKHLCYFRTPEQCTELIDRFGADEAGRKAIAAAGMARVHEAFNCRVLAAHVVELATTGRCDAPWADVL